MFSVLFTEYRRVSIPINTTRPPASPVNPGRNGFFRVYPGFSELRGISRKAIAAKRDLKASSTLSAFTDAALASAERNRANSNDASPVRFTPNLDPGSGNCREDLLTFSPCVASLLSSIQSTSYASPPAPSVQRVGESSSRLRIGMLAMVIPLFVREPHLRSETTEGSRPFGPRIRRRRSKWREHVTQRWPPPPCASWSAYRLMTSLS